MAVVLAATSDDLVGAKAAVTTAVKMASLVAEAKAVWRAEAKAAKLVESMVCQMAAA